MGCHRNHAISHSPNQNYFEDTFVWHPGGPNEQFGTHEKLSLGVQGNLNWMPGYRLCSFFFFFPLKCKTGESSTVARPFVYDEDLKWTCNSYTMGCPPVRGDNPRALASGLSYVQVDKHGITILCHLHQCRPCKSRDISC